MSTEHELLVDKLFTQKPSWIEGAVSRQKACFLTGLVIENKIKNAVEIGVASGWSSVVLINALLQKDGFETLTGIDIQTDYYKNESYRVGQAIEELFPHINSGYRLYTDSISLDVCHKISNIDFAFIDGNHKHPWPTIDFISILPALKNNAWVVVDDINVCRMKRKKHRQRGAYYLYHFWGGKKIAQNLSVPQIGALKVTEPKRDYLDDLLEMLFTPWEEPISGLHTEKLIELIKSHFGSKWAITFSQAVEKMNSVFK